MVSDRLGGHGSITVIVPPFMLLTIRSSRPQSGVMCSGHVTDREPIDHLEGRRIDHRDVVGLLVRDVYPFRDIGRPRIDLAADRGCVHAAGGRGRASVHTGDRRDRRRVGLGAAASTRGGGAAEVDWLGGRRRAGRQSRHPRAVAHRRDAPAQRMLPLWPRLMLPGCGQKVRPCGLPPVGMTLTTLPGLGVEDHDRAMEAIGDPQLAAVRRDGRHVRRAAALPRVDDLAGCDVDHRDGACVAVRDEAAGDSRLKAKPWAPVRGRDEVDRAPSSSASTTSTPFVPWLATKKTSPAGARRMSSGDPPSVHRAHDLEVDGVDLGDDAPALSAAHHQVAPIGGEVEMVRRPATGPGRT